MFIIFLFYANKQFLKKHFLKFIKDLFNDRKKGFNSIYFEKTFIPKDCMHIYMIWSHKFAPDSFILTLIVLLILRKINFSHKITLENYKKHFDSQ